MSAAALMAVACDEDDFSEDYDINFPVARIDSVSNITPEAGTTITIFGEDLLTTNEFYIGSRKMEFTDPKVFDEAKAVVIIPRVVEAGEIVTTNIYGSKFSSMLAPHSSLPRLASGPMSWLLAIASPSRARIWICSRT